MKGLLRKDLYNIRKQLLWYLSMLVVFFILAVALDNLSFSVSISILISTSVPVTAIAYEEKENWQKFAVAGGLSAKEISGEKYLLGLICCTISSAVFGAAFLIVGRGQNLNFSDFLIPICMQILVLSANLPIVFRYGVEKGRVIIIGLIVAVLVAWIGIMTFSEKISGNSGAIVWIVSAAVSVLSLILSMHISERICAKKEY